MAMWRAERATVLAAVTLSVVGCSGYAVQTLSSNPGVKPQTQYPDGGGNIVPVVCPIPRPGNEGSATLSGLHSFNVGAALEVAQQWVQLHPDGGADGGASPPTPDGLPFVSLSLFDSAVSCDASKRPLAAQAGSGDGGVSWNNYVFLEMSAPYVDSYVGSYHVVVDPDAGAIGEVAGYVMAFPPDGGARLDYAIVAGELDIDAVESCSLQGTFQFDLAAAGPVQYCGIPDGGAPISCNGDGPSKISGVIAPVYCR
jgi:hypothetical protein